MAISLSRSTQTCFTRQPLQVQVGGSLEEKTFHGKILLTPETCSSQMYFTPQPFQVQVDGSLKRGLEGHDEDEVGRL
jgi:hypothetical protein